MNRTKIELGVRLMIFVSRLTNSYVSSVNRCSVAGRYVFALLLILIMFSQSAVACLNGSLVASPPAVDLSGEGVSDWAHWGLL